MNEDKATRYHRLGRRASLLATAWSLVLLAGLLITGASGVLRTMAAAAASSIGAPESPSAVVAVYVLALSLIVDLAALPLGFYKGFLLERRFGLATETMGHWLKDHLKAVGVGIVFAEIGALFVYATLRHWPELWWLVSGLAYSLVINLLVNLAPVLLLPLFYTFKPLEKATLRDRLTTLAAKADTSIKGVYEWTLSDRTKRANAALTGIGHTRRILLSDTLLADYSDDEIEVILAHELAHHVHRDIWSALVLDGLFTFGGFYAAHRLLQRAVPVLGLQSAGDVAGIPVLLMAAGALGLAVKPVMNAVSRSHERRADRYALQLTKNPSAFLSAMRRLGQQNLAEENPSRLVQAFFYTHPPIKDRLRAAQEWATALTLLAVLAWPLRAQQPPAPQPGGTGRGNPAETEVWRPVPRTVTPGQATVTAPSDAIVLFDGRSLDEWVSTRDKSPAGWTVANGILTVNKAAGNIETKRRFRSFQLHIEWLIPETITGSGQGRGNSGVFLASTGPGDSGYELQVLDSYNNETYVNGQAGSVYKQSIPLVNASRRPGEWQAYDVIWTAPVFNAAASLQTPAYVTVLQNGVVIQNHFELKGETVFIGTPEYKKYDSAPIKLQAHGDPSPPISFRNIWVRELS